MKVEFSTRLVRSFYSIVSLFITWVFERVFTLYVCVQAVHGASHGAELL